MLTCRAKALGEDNWVYGYYVRLNSHQNRGRIFPEHATNIHESIHVELVTLCRGTSLFDKNGKPIFEYDVLEWHFDPQHHHHEKPNPSRFICKEDRSNDCVGFVLKSLEKYPFNSRKFIPHVATDLEVIGNTIDNPNLLRTEYGTLR